MSNYHKPVMLNECIENLHIATNGIYADCTLGGGGHSLAIAELLGENGKLHCFDRDPEAIAEAAKKLATHREKIVFHCKPFSELSKEILPNELNGILYDFGVSSHQIDDLERGFSFNSKNLDMRMNAEAGENAKDYLETISAKDLAKALSENSDLDKANRLATRILSGVASCATENREITSADLNAAIEEIYYNRKEHWNSLKARVFQAIRMEVNNEISEIKMSVLAAVECLKEGGRLCAITYHSKEAQAVKETMAVFEKNCVCPPELPVCRCGGNNRKIKKISRKPILPTQEEISKNSRARSACLRVYERIGK